jgi:peptidyl-prolyl cis-trans isomerase C
MNGANPLRADAVAARVNHVPVALDSEDLSAEELRQRACTELLRQEALRAGLLDPADPPPVAGATSEAASAAIEALLEQALDLPEPGEAACRRHHAANAARYATGERAQVRHILFAVTPGVDVNALRKRAEACLIDVRADGTGERFAMAAAQLSNCPTGAQGGDLGWLQPADCAPEFAREVFGHAEVGVLARLVATRFGLHVVEVLAREPGVVPAFERVQGAVAQGLRQQLFATALRQYLQVLAGQAQLQGVDLEAATSPLVQ